MADNQIIKDDLKIFALGGLCEVGKNMYCMEYKDEIIILDCGILFPDNDMYGIDYIIPDFTYLIENQDKIKALFITHGHEDHIGGIPYLLKTVKIPKIFANGLALELIKKKLEDYGISNAPLYELPEYERVKFKNFGVSLFRVNHSIADSFGLVINTPFGDIVETGDFKFDFTPVGKDADYHRINVLGARGVLLLMSDSTNARVPGLSVSERTVAENIHDLFREVNGRVIIATFASNVNRINAIIESSIQTGRKVCVVGRSMEHILEIGKNLGYINASPDDFIEIKDLESLPHEKITIICTGTQGEPMAALTRIAVGNHKQIHIEKNDTVIFSSSAIPGNSPEIDSVINLLTRAGANVIVRSSFNDVHASGHASSNEEKLMIKLLRPRYFMPMHGEYYMLKTHAQSAISCGVNPKNVFVMENGKVLSISENGAKILSKKVQAGNILIDGTDVGGINTAVMEQRKQLSLTGMISIVATLDKDGKIMVRPTIISKGFLYAKDNEEIFKKIEAYISEYFEEHPVKDKVKAKKEFEDAMQEYVYSMSKQKPSIFAIINQVA